MKPWSQHEESCRTPPPLLWQGHSRADITHNTLSCLFPWCNKRCRTKKKKKVHEFRAARFPSRRDLTCVSADLSPTRSLMSHQGCSLGPERGERKGTIALLLKFLRGRLQNSRPLECIEGSERVRPQLLELSWCYDTSSNLQLSIFNSCVCGLVWGAGISSSALPAKQSSE